MSELLTSNSMSIPADRLADVVRIVEDFVRRNSRWVNSNGVEQDPYGAHGWLEWYRSTSHETTARLGPREPNNDMVICPNCTSQFGAIPVNIQLQMSVFERALTRIASLAPTGPDLIGPLHGAGLAAGFKIAGDVAREALDWLPVKTSSPLQDDIAAEFDQ